LERFISFGLVSCASELTPDEDAEYEALTDGADLITILKLKAQRVLAA
jgi:hypothetical protein